MAGSVADAGDVSLSKDEEEILDAAGQDVSGFGSDSGRTGFGIAAFEYVASNRDGLSPSVRQQFAHFVNEGLGPGSADWSAKI